MSGMTAYLLRLCIGGICCAVAVTLSGVGGKREITRFASTCIMLLLCFSGIREIEIADFDVQDEHQLQDAVDDALKDRLEVQQTEVDLVLAQYIQEQALSMGYTCRVTVDSQLEDGEYQIKLVTLGTEGAVAQPELQSWIVNTFKLKETQLRWEDNP